MISDLGNLKSNDRNPKKKELHNKMIKQAFIIAKSIPFGKCTKEMLDKYDSLVDEYYKAFPDKIAHARTKQKLSRLRTLAK